MPGPPGRPRPSASRDLTVLSFVALAALGAAPAAAAPRAPIHGTYRVHGTGRVVARPVLSRGFELRADVVLRAGPSADTVRVSVSAEGATCDLEATLDDAGALAFRPDQRCAADVRSSDTRAHVDARLRSGSGRVGGGELALELAWELAGTVSFQAARRVEVGGTPVDLPPMWTPAVPVRGEAQGSGTGHLDASRAAPPVR